MPQLGREGIPHVTLTLIQVDCPSCSNTSFTPVRQLNGYSIVECTTCTLRFVNPRPEELQILRAYTRESLNDELSFAFDYEARHEVDDFYSWTGVYVLQRLKRFGLGTFLDVGAGHGWTVKRALEIGWDAYGYEFGDDRSYEKESRLARNIFKTPEEIKKKFKQFDHVFSSAVLEHTCRPMDFVKEWMEYLKPKGYFTLSSIPTMDSIFIHMGIDSWEGNIPPAHLNYFTQQSMKNFLKRANCKIVDFYTMGAPVTFGPQFISKQRRFDRPYWGNRSQDWARSQNKQTQGLQNQDSLLRHFTTASINHLLKALGWGSNLYVTFQKN